MNKILCSLIVAIAATMIVAEVPSFIKICGRRNPNLNQCVENSVNSLRDTLRHGIPSLNVPPIEPLEVGEGGLPLISSEQITAHARDVKLYNLYSFEMKKIHVDLENQRVNVDLLFNSIRMTANYNVSAKVVVPLQGSGPVEFDTRGINAKSTLLFKITNTKKGKQLFFTEMTCKLSIEGYTSKFVTNSGADPTFSDLVNSILNTQQEEILRRITPKLEKTVSKKVLEFANKICNHFTYDELFPDRE